MRDTWHEYGAMAEVKTQCRDGASPVSFDAAGDAAGCVYTSATRSFSARLGAASPQARSSPDSVHKRTVQIFVRVARTAAPPWRIRNARTSRRYSSFLFQLSPSPRNSRPAGGASGND